MKDDDEDCGVKWIDNLSDIGWNWVTVILFIVAFLLGGWLL